MLKLNYNSFHFYFSENGVTEPFHAQLEFYVYLVSGATGNHTREARGLRFWFKPQMPPNERPHEAQAFFRELVSPQDFPKGIFDIMYYLFWVPKLISWSWLRYMRIMSFYAKARFQNNILGNNTIDLLLYCSSIYLLVVLRCLPVPFNLKKTTLLNIN